MAQEEHVLGCSYSGGGGGGSGGGGGGGGSGCSGGPSSSGRSKKIKQKKVPQRGLGVAQLEKIRIEEQQKKQSLNAANILAKNATSNTSPFLAVQCSNLRPAGLSPFHNSLSLPPSSSTITNLPSPNELYRHSPSLSNIETSVRILNASSETTVNGNWPRLWNGEHNLAGEKQGVDHHGFAFEPYESNTNTLVLPVQRSHQFQRSSSSSSMLQVNSSSGISPSSELSSQMEPPSNQSFRGNNYAPLWTEQDKMVGMKRPCPFSLESPGCNFHPSYAASISKSDEIASCSNGYTAHMEPRNKCIREGPSNSDPNPNQVNKDNGMLNGDFLTLAPPAVASPPLNSKHKHPFDYSGHQGKELSEYESIPSQEYAKSRIHQPGPSESVKKSFSFFPIKLETNQTTPHVSNGSNGEKGETIDLNLKL